MDAVFQYKIPFLHPLAVHFPLSFLLAAALAAFVWMFCGTAFWRKTCLFVLVLGMASAFFAYFTGRELGEQAEGMAIVDDLVGLHEQMALYTLVAAGGASLALGLFSIRAERLNEERDGLGYRIVVGCLILLAAALVSWTAHVGTTMVWGVAA